MSSLRTWPLIAATALTAACGGAQSSRVSVAHTTVRRAWHQWVATPGSDAIESVARSADGATYAVGRDQHGVFIARYTAAGERSWSQPLHGLDAGPPPALAVDAAGTVYVAGGFADRLRVGATTLAGSARKDVFVLHLDARGEVVSAARYGGSWFETARAIAVDRAGDVYVAGTYQRELDLHGAVIHNGVENDVFVAKFDARGAHRWNTRLADRGCLDARGNALALGPDGDVYVAGLACRRVTFEGEPAPDRDERATPHAFVARLSDAGAVRWLQSLEASERSEAIDLALSPDGRVVVAGLFDGSITLDGASRASRMSDVFVASWSADGSRRWVRTLGGVDDEERPSVSVGLRGEVFVGGGRHGALECEGDALPGDGADGFIARFDRDGAQRGFVSLTSEGDDAVRDLVIDGDDALIAGVGGALPLGGATHAAQGRGDGFVARSSLASLGFAPIAAPQALDPIARAPAARAIATPPADATAVVRISFSSGDESYANLRFTVEAGGVTTEGVTDEHGVAEFRVPSDDSEATLSVPDRAFSSAVHVGTLDPIDEPSGQASRLQSLGYRGYFVREPRPRGLGESARELRDELGRFQRDHGLPATGDFDAATRRELARAHGS